MPRVLGVDSSTQSCKVEVRDADSGELLATGRADHPTVHPPRAEQDPSAWWNALTAAVRDAGVRHVDAIAVAGQQHGMVALDAHDEVIRPAKLWNDTESAPDAEWLLEKLGGGAAWADACGSVPVASFTITKLSWLHRNEPDAWKQLRRVLLPHDYLTHRLTGLHTTDRGDASGTGYWSPAEDAYRPDLLAIVDADRDWARVLPEVLDPRAEVAKLASDAADALGLRGAPLVAPGTGDNMAAALGVGLELGDVAISIGTSGTIYAVAEQPAADPTGAVAGFADATGRFLPLVCTLNATRVTDTVAALLGVDHQGLDRLASACEAGAGGVTLVPYFAGERTPNRPEATGTIVGLRTDVTREQLARAAFDGVVCGLLEGLDALSTAGVAVEDGRLVLTGGGARSPAFRQIIADLSQREVSVSAGDEHVATGACIQAAAVVGGTPFDDVARAWGVRGASLVTPRQAVDHEGIRAAYAAARG
jgi:xylulokinase